MPTFSRMKEVPLLLRPGIGRRLLVQVERPQVRGFVSPRNKELINKSCKVGDWAIKKAFSEWSFV